MRRQAGAFADRCSEKRSQHWGCLWPSNFLKRWTRCSPRGEDHGAREAVMAMMTGGSGESANSGADSGTPNERHFRGGEGIWARHSLIHQRDGARESAKALGARLGRPDGFQHRLGSVQVRLCARLQGQAHLSLLSPSVCADRRRLQRPASRDENRMGDAVSIAVNSVPRPGSRLLF